ncbi:MAG TPA: phosphopantetheine-binding protein [Balneolales bacterium]|nr:phosphopantetheine-binding protein [Balneolales bacterium]
MSDDIARRAIIKVLGNIAPEAEVDKIEPNENLREALDLDSVDFLNFLVGLHDELGVEIPESDYGRLNTLSDIINYLTTKV